MILSTKIAPSNSLLLLMDGVEGEIPGSIDGHEVSVTSTCIAIGTLCEIDGETEIILTNEKSCPNMDPELSFVFSGTLITRQNILDVMTVDLQKVLSIEVSRVHCRVDVWTNRAKEPNKICFVVE